MRKTTLWAAVAGLASMALSGSVSATYLRCGGQLIEGGGRSGPGMYEVLKKCGKPTERYGNTWIYVRSGQPNRILHFSDSGQLQSIRTESSR